MGAYNAFSSCPNYSLWVLLVSPIPDLLLIQILSALGQVLLCWWYSLSLTFSGVSCMSFSYIHFNMMEYQLSKEGQPGGCLGVESCF